MSTGTSIELNLVKRRSRRYWHYALILVLVSVLNFARLLETEPLRSANDRSRWTTVWSLVERGTYQIDEIRERAGWDTIDLVRHEGHFYSSKPPLLSTLVAGGYWMVTNTLRWTLDHHLLATTRLLLVLINLVPMMLALCLFVRLVERYAASDFTRFFLVVAASTATLLQPFLTVLNNHTPGAIFCLFTLYAVIEILVERRKEGWLFAVAGFAAATTCCVELTAALFGLAIFALLVQDNPRQTFRWFVPAALIPLAAFFVTNYLATGGWKPFYLFYGTEKYEFIENGVPSYWMFPRGIDQAKDGTLAYLLHCTIGHHGVLSLTPMYLLIIPCWFSGRTWTGSPLRKIHGLGLLLTAAVFCFFLAKTENYNYGGVSVALRWLLWLTPFWLLAMLSGLETWRPEFRGRVLCLALLAVSLFSAWYPFSSPWQQPWLFRLMEMADRIDYSDPELPLGPRFHSWIRQLPRAEDGPYWIEFEGVNGDGQLERLRIEAVADGDRDLPDEGDGDVCWVRLTSSNVSADGMETATSESTIALSREAFRSHRPLKEIVVASQGTAGDELTEAIQTIRGLPAPQLPPGREASADVSQIPRYRPRVIRYVAAPALERDEKFQCIQATGEVWRSSARDLPATVHRRDLWMTDDVPFGVLAFEESIRSATTGDTLSRQRMMAVRASHVEPFDAARLLQNR